jgi:hypothetical protein
LAHAPKSPRSSRNALCGAAGKCSAGLLVVERVHDIRGNLKNMASKPWVIAALQLGHRAVRVPGGSGESHRLHHPFARPAQGDAEVIIAVFVPLRALCMGNR